jgi:hypothetical protein
MGTIKFHKLKDKNVLLISKTINQIEKLIYTKNFLLP